MFLLLGNILREASRPARMKPLQISNRPVKKLPDTNTLAYFALSSVKTWQNEVFVHGQPTLLSLLRASKVYPSGAPFRCLPQARARKH
jgi:hypothetical protein